MRLLRLLLYITIIPVLLGVPSRTIVARAPVSPKAVALNARTVHARGHLVRDYPARHDDGTVNAVIEIPSGTVAKFEVGDDGVLRWALDRDDQSPREIDYLAFPVNYGMIPRTLADDGDPLDILVLGAQIERAHVARVRVIGVLRMGHDGTRDDKLIAVPTEAALENGFSDLQNLAELDARYPATRAILRLWFAYYWGKGATNVLGWGDRAEADEILVRACDAFRQ